ncbi:MAG: TraR/DksA C4-type zinc finger protein [Chloroflexi bacterium]|nr:TraR/DksA C4-type zinc finger protein [Chloroflexota bacterium]
MASHTHQTERRRIDNEITLVEEELQHLLVKLQEKPEWSLGDGDPGVQEWEMNYALKQEAERKLKSLQTAIQKLERGQYAICEVCGQVIDPERLAILPETTRCVTCARKKL